jgi:hypothetical protein
MTIPGARPRSDLVPARLLPLLYFATGYLALPLAFAVVAVNPRAVGGFFYHSRLIGVVHLVTLGWITSAILGALYIVLPVALRSSLPARKADYWAFAFVLTGIIGMVAHFWLEAFSGMAWSGVMVALGIVYVGARVMPRVARAPIHGAVKLHVLLAFVNMALAATAGVAIGFDKVYHFLPGYVISNVLAHAHLAALGWASMMVIGVGYRLLPMVLAAKTPTGHGLYASAALLELAALGLFVSLTLRSGWSWLFASSAAGAFAVFVTHVRRMQRRRPAAGLPKPDIGAWHALQALAYLVLAILLGIALTWIEPSEWTMRLALVYGVFGLIGFLAQMVMGMQMRLVPMAAWYWNYVLTGAPPTISAHAMASLRWAIVSFILWTAAVPTIAFGFALNSPGLLSAGAWTGCVATIISGVQGLFVVRHAFNTPAWMPLKLRNLAHP